MWWVAAALVSAMVGTWVALLGSAAGTLWVWAGFAVFQVPCAVVCVRRLVRDGELGDKLVPRWGDMTAGGLSGAVLLAMVWFAQARLAPSGSMQNRWLIRVFEHTGELAWLERIWWAVLLAVVVVSVLQELVWRGLVLPTIEAKVGTRRAWPIAGLLYGCGFVPSLWLLRTEAGLNPLVVAIGILGGFVWSFMAARSSRLVPSILSHVIFVWFFVVQFRLMGVSGEG